MAERSVLLKNLKHPFLVGLHFSFQTTDKLYFVLDYVNGGEVGAAPLCIATCHTSTCPVIVANKQDTLTGLNDGFSYR